MSVLTKSDIARRMAKSIGARLIVTPLINPKESIGAASIDVRLGNTFIVMKRESFPVLDLDQEVSMERVGKYQHQIRVNYHEAFILHPRQLVIGSTFEYIQVPAGLMCYVAGKSSWGRMGLIIATATKVDPGFKGCITLEIVNEGEVPIKLYPGLPIAQLVFHEASNKGDIYDGQYTCPIGPQFPRFNKNKDWEFWMPNKSSSGNE